MGVHRQQHRARNCPKERRPPPRTTAGAATCQRVTIDPGADPGAAVEVDDVVVGHADAAGRHRLADRVGLVRAVDAIERAGEVHRARAERIVDAALHVARQVGTAPQHLRRRGPVRPFALVGDVGHARPGEARPADADAVSQRLMVGQDVIEPPLAGADDDRAGRLPAVELRRSRAGSAKRPAATGNRAALANAGAVPALKKRPASDGGANEGAAHGFPLKIFPNSTAHGQDCSARGVARSCPNMATMQAARRRFRQDLESHLS